jgi:hypothetical protein
MTTNFDVVTFEPGDLQFTLGNGSLDTKPFTHQITPKCKFKLPAKGGRVDKAENTEEQTSTVTEVGAGASDAVVRSTVKGGSGEKDDEGVKKKVSFAVPPLKTGVSRVKVVVNLKSWTCLERIVVTTYDESGEVMEALTKGPPEGR